MKETGRQLINNSNLNTNSNQNQTSSQQAFQPKSARQGQSSSHKQEQPGSSAAVQQSFTKQQLKLQQMPSETTPKHGQGTLSGMGSGFLAAGGTSVVWQRGENQHSSSAVQQILNNHQQQKRDLPSQGQFSQSNPFNKKNIKGEHDKQIGPAGLPTKDAGPLENQAGINPAQVQQQNEMNPVSNQLFGRSRSPHQTSVFKRHPAGLQAQQNPVGSKANLSLIAHPYSETKRSQNQEAPAQKAAQIRASQYGHFSGTNVLEQNNSQSAVQNIQSKSGVLTQQHRAAGKATTKQPVGDGHPLFMDSSSSVWKTNEPQAKPSEEKTSVSHSAHSNIFSQVGKGAFQRKQFAAATEAFYGSRDNILNPLVSVPGARSYYQQFANIDTPVNVQNMHMKQQRNHTIQKEDIPKPISPTNVFNQIAGSTNTNSGPNTASEIDTSTSANTRGFKAQTMSTHLNNLNTTLTNEQGDQFIVSGQKVVHESYEFAKPHLIQNKGGLGASQAQRKTFSRGRKGQPNMMSSGRAVMGLPLQSDAQQTQEVLNTSNIQPLDESQTIEMTPEQSKDKVKRRSLNIAESTSVVIKVPIQQKAQPNLHNTGTLEQLEEEHRAQATRANSIGKTNKRNNKLTHQPLKAGQTTDFQDLFQIQNYNKEQIQAMRHQSFQGGKRIQPIKKNALFKLQSQNHPQLNDPAASVTISLQSSVPGSESAIPQSSFPGSQDFKSTTAPQSSSVEEQITQSQTQQSKKNNIQPASISHIQAQHKQLQDKLKKTRTEEPTNVQRHQIQHSPEDNEQAKNDQQPINKIQRTPLSNRKRLVIPMQMQPPPVSPSAKVDGQKRGKVSPKRISINAQNLGEQAKYMEKKPDQQTMVVDIDPPKDELHDMRNKKSHKHRQIIKHNKQLQQIHNLNVSSFNSQKKSNKSDDEERNDNENSDDQEVQEQSSDDDLERDEFAAVPDMGQGLTPEVAVISAGKKPQEEEEKEVISVNSYDPNIPDGKQSGMLPQISNKEFALQQESRHRKTEVRHRVPPILGKKQEKVFTNLKRDLLDSESLSKFNHSSDSSFTRTFYKLLEESEGLRWQYKMILRRQLSIENDVYSNFVKNVIFKNKELLQNYSRSMPLNRKREDFFDQMKPFTFENVVQLIENEKLRHAQSEQNQRDDNVRLVHSDMSGRFLTNSGGQSHASILSPNFSKSGIRGYRHMHSHKRRLHRYLSVSYGGFQKQANSANCFALPDLFHRQRNSVCHFGVKLGGISDNSLSQRYQRAKESSTSNKTTPTPSQNNNQKLQNLTDAANKVQIPVYQAAQPQSLAQLYGRRNQQEKQQEKILGIQEKIFNNFQQLANKQQQKIKDNKQENNFFQTRAQRQANQVYGTIIEWQQGKLIGRGTTGEVYEAIDINSGEMFVVKKIQLVHAINGLDQSKAKAVKKEIDRYKNLDCKYIVRYLGCEIIENNVFCIYLEYMPGGSLADICREYGRIGESIARSYIHQILKALNYLHSNNIVHGDLKGANVLCSKDARDTKLCDLGNSLQFDHDKSMASVNSVCQGTLAWMAPEAQFSKIGKKSDVWSLGCLLVEITTGENPWGKRLYDGNSVVIALQTALMAKERPEIPKHVSIECRNFIDRCLNHSYKDRPYAHELLEDPWIKQLGPQSTSS